MLAERGRLEQRYISEVSETLASRVALIPWQIEDPIGSERLRQIAEAAVLKVKRKGHMKELEQYFKALGDTNRLRILNLLLHGELCVCDIQYVLEAYTAKCFSSSFISEELGPCPRPPGWLPNLLPARSTRSKG